MKTTLGIVIILQVTLNLFVTLIKLSVYMIKCIVYSLFQKLKIISTGMKAVVCTKYGPPEVHSSRKRTKEIGMRKINGATVFGVISLLNRDFFRWIIIAFIPASLIAWYIMNRWLLGFAYRTELNLWIFALAGLLTVTIAFLTVSWQSLKAATMNPVETLRYE